MAARPQRGTLGTGGRGGVGAGARVAVAALRLAGTLAREDLLAVGRPAALGGSQEACVSQKRSSPQCPQIATHLAEVAALA